MPLRLLRRNNAFLQCICHSACSQLSSMQQLVSEHIQSTAPRRRGGMPGAARVRPSGIQLGGATRGGAGRPAGGLLLCFRAELSQIQPLRHSTLQELCIAAALLQHAAEMACRGRACRKSHDSSMATTYIFRRVYTLARRPHRIGGCSTTAADPAAQVWDKKAQAQVLQVAPFLPRRTRGAATGSGAAASAQEMAAEMERVQVCCEAGSFLALLLYQDWQTAVC
jgi:hypothetical protein